LQPGATSGTNSSHTPEPPSDTDTAKAEALSWLASRHRWEQLLADLHDLIERESAVVKLQPPAGTRKGDSSAA
jgi:hypothetical protein